MTPPTSVQVPHTCSSQYKMRELPDPDCLACTTTSVQTVTAELLPLTFEGIEDFLCEGNCKTPGMCNDTEITWCGRKAEAFVKSIATLTSSLTAAEAPMRELERLLRECRRFMDPASDPTRLTHSAMAAQINRALSQTGEGRNAKAD